MLNGIHVLTYLITRLIFVSVCHKEFKAHQIQQTTPNLESEFSQKKLPIKLGKSKKSSLFIYKLLERLLSRLDITMQPLIHPILSQIFDSCFLFS